MRAMILAAGRGERMGSLTQHCPKPLLKVAGYHLIEYMITALVKADVECIVMNVSYLGAQIEAILGDGKKYGTRILYSYEKERLETGGGIFQALPLLGGQPFIVVSGDVISDYPLSLLPATLQGLAHLVMVNNPSFHPQGDFHLKENLLYREANPKLTFANIGVYHPDLFLSCQPGRFPLSQLLRSAMKKQQITGEHYQGIWHNIGTFAELQAAEKELRAREDSNLRPLASETNTLSN